MSNLCNHTTLYMFLVNFTVLPVNFVSQDEPVVISEGNHSTICLNHSGSLEREVIITIHPELLDASFNGNGGTPLC